MKDSGKDPFWTSSESNPVILGTICCFVLMYKSFDACQKVSTNQSPKSSEEARMSNVVLESGMESELPRNRSRRLFSFGSLPCHENF